MLTKCYNKYVIKRKRNNSKRAFLKKLEKSFRNHLTNSTKYAIILTQGESQK